MIVFLITCPVAELLLVLADPILSREQCLPGQLSCGRGSGVIYWFLTKNGPIRHQNVPYFRQLSNGLTQSFGGGGGQKGYKFYGGRELTGAPNGNVMLLDRGSGAQPQIFLDFSTL